MSAHRFTPKRERVYEFIKNYIASNNQAPTMAEIGRQFQMRSSASVHQVLVNLEKDGKIKRVPNVSRGIQIVPPAPMPPVNAS